MYFHGGYEEVILFDFWKINTLSGLIASMVASFMLSVFHEFLSIYLENCKRRENASKYTNLVEESRIFKKSLLKQKLSDCALCSKKGSDDISIEDNSDTQIEEKDYNSIKYYMEIKRCNSSLTKILIVILHLFQVTLAYFLMLIVMNLNYWLCGAVILGSTMGHFVF